MMKTLSTGTCAVAVGAALLLTTGATRRTSASAGLLQNALASALTFHAAFDGGVDARHALGDPRLYTAPSFARRGERTAGLPANGEVALAQGRGRFGDGLAFTVHRKPLIFFDAAGNVPYATTDWSGTVSVWLRLAPEIELQPGFSDPVQVMGRAWNDAAFFVEFEKTPTAIPFRLGAYADLAVWNPTGRRFQDIPGSERPLVTVNDPPFAGDRWTHVVFTFEHFNTGRSDGLARLYLDGRPAGDITAREQTFTWNADARVITLGLNYVGLLDELSVFNRALTADEVWVLHGLPSGVTSLGR